MKKTLRALFFIFIMLIFCDNRYAKAFEPTQEDTLILPTALTKIDEEAFAGTNAEIVIFPYGFMSIGNKAFEGALGLTDIYIPPTTEYIAETAFSSNTKLIIHGVEGSLAGRYAKSHRIPFVADDIWNPSYINGNIMITAGKVVEFLHGFADVRILKHYSGFAYNYISRRPQDRSELNALDYWFP